MSDRRCRRAFLKRAAAGGAFLGCLDLFSKRPGRSGLAIQRQASAQIVGLHGQIEPLVRLLEETPRGELIDVFAERVRGGLGYREALAALLLAGVRNVEPRPSVGFKFHTVLAVNSVRLAGLASPESDRWLPIFWALDYFKDSQARDERERGWTMGPVAEPAVPSHDKVRGAFITAMDAWDEPVADAAIAGLARAVGPDELFELFYRYGARDFRSIGHKAIYVAGARRTLEDIGWRYTEPVFRSMAYALLMHEGENPAKRDAAADLPWRRNQGLASRIRPDWKEGGPNSEATVRMLAACRDGSEDDACDEVVALLNRGVGSQAIWDALFASAGELLLRQPGIVALHAVTTTNALSYAYRASRYDRTQRLMLLQNAAFLPMFREAMRGRGSVGDLRIDELEPLAPRSSGRGAIEEVLSEVSEDRMTAVRKALSLLQNESQASRLIAGARGVLVRKGNDAHDYKFGSAVFEDYDRVSEGWRERCLAAAAVQLCGAGESDNPVIEHAKAALDA